MEKVYLHIDLGETPVELEEKLKEEFLGEDRFCNWKVFFFRKRDHKTQIELSFSNTENIVLNNGFIIEHEEILRYLEKIIYKDLAHLNLDYDCTTD